MTNNKSLKVYILAYALLSELDGIENEDFFKQEFKFHAKKVMSKLEQFDKEVFKVGQDKNAMNEVVSEMMKNIESSLK